MIIVEGLVGRIGLAVARAWGGAQDAAGAWGERGSGEDVGTNTNTKGTQCPLHCNNQLHFCLSLWDQ